MAGKSSRDIELEQMATSINEILLAAEPGARTSRIFYRTNVTVDEGKNHYYGSRKGETHVALVPTFHKSVCKVAPFSFRSCSFCL